VGNGGVGDCKELIFSVNLLVEDGLGNIDDLNQGLFDTVLCVIFLFELNVMLNPSGVIFLILNI
jgi:hypothetical protein